MLKSTRDAYGDTLLEIGSSENNIIVLDADLSKSTQTYKFAKQFPERFFNCGCAEQNMIGIAAGLALSGKIVFASTYSIFLMRSWEQLRTVSHDNLNVKLCVTHSGLTNAPDGASHQSLEDLALMKVIPNMVVINPCDSIETEKVIESEINRKGPCYIRLNREATRVITEDYYRNNKFELGKTVRLRGGNDIGNGNDLGIIATGTMVHKALEVADILEKHRIYCTVYNICSIKPIDKDAIIELGRKTGKIVTMEEHSVIGGLGSSVSEILGDNYPVPIKMIGINDVFGESGTYDQLLDKHGLNTEKMIGQIKDRFFRYETW